MEWGNGLAIYLTPIPVQTSNTSLKTLDFFPGSLLAQYLHIHALS